MARNRRLRKKKKNIISKKTKFIIIIVIIVFLITLFSIVFSLINAGNNKIIIGVTIGNIDVSNLEKNDALDKINEYMNENILKDITVKYDELEENINIEQLKVTIDAEKLIKDALNVGRTGNIIKDNYEILRCLLFKKNINYNLNISEEQIERKVEELNSKLPNAMQETNYYIENDNLIITKGKEGITIDEEKFRNLLIKTINENGEKEIKIPVKETKPKDIDLEKIYEEVYKEAKDAYITNDPLEVHSHVNGVDFDISKEQAKQMLEEEKDEYIIPLKITIPGVTLKDLSQEAFPQILGSFTTTYSASNENRETNLKLASEKINGTIVLPGEIFSYNKVVGERTIAKGYKEAAVYSGGKVIDGIGGGICQLSSTLYNAAVYANLEITSRTNHRFLTSYVDAGRDATVSWGTIDFCFKNTRNYPIKINSIVKNGIVTIQICGIKEEKEYEISIESTVTEILPYTVNYVRDNSLEDGEQEIKQYGANGAESITYKVIKNNGNVISKEILSTDTYSPLERIVLIGGEKTQEVNAEESNNIEKINPKLLELIQELY